MFHTNSTIDSGYTGISDTVSDVPMTISVTVYDVVVGRARRVDPGPGPGSGPKIFNKSGPGPKILINRVRVQKRWTRRVLVVGAIFYFYIFHAPFSSYFTKDS
jgi:hypothetical protein